MAARTNAVAQPAERELVISRVLDAPRSLVFKAWTEPEHFVRWWGPNGFTTPFCKMDVRPGGVTHFCMRSPEGRDYWGRWVYLEIVPPERIVFTDTFADEEGNPVDPAHYGMPDWPFETLVTVTLTEDRGKTKLTLHHAVDLSLAESNGAAQGWSECLDRLAAELAQA
ncbi:MAG TPA: SRPBCC domain-containing protein [Geminicoccaceae bacterium]|nr:SRPBCC domain-containing protein [Geminicoccaceae bacterium]